MAKTTSSRAGWWQLGGLVVAAAGAAVLVPACGSDSSSDKDSQPDAGGDGSLLPAPSPYMAVSIDPPSVPADGTSVATVTVRFRNPENNLPWKGQQVVLTSSGKGNRIAMPSNVTNDDGVVTATISSTLVESKTITAQVGSYYNTTSVDFTGCKSALFVPLTPIPAGRDPQQRLAGDFNRDGKTDIAFRTNGKSLAMWLGNGDGTFRPGTGYESANAIGTMAKGDFNGDGKLDIAIASANSANNALTILAGRGDGAFDRVTEYAFAKDVVVHAVGDYNGDGKQDLVTRSYGENTVGVRLGNGDGTFQLPTNAPVAQQPVSAASGDFNGDGKLDLGVLTESDRKLSILLGNGNGTFQPGRAYAYDSADGLSSSLAADTNSDNRSDLVVTNYQGGMDVFLANSDGSFASPIHTPIGGGTLASSADIDGDGKLDLLMSHADEESYLSLMFGAGNGTFPAEIKYDGFGSYAANGTVAADFTGDDRMDFALTTYDAIKVFVRTGCTR